MNKREAKELLSERWMQQNRRSKMYLRMMVAGVAIGEKVIVFTLDDCKEFMKLMRKIIDDEPTCESEETENGEIKGISDNKTRSGGRSHSRDTEER